MSTTWNYTLEDTSPIINYEPYSDGNLTGGWQTWYSGSGFNHEFGEASSGDSFHLSSFSGARLSLSFFGVGISLIGSANCSYQVVLDGVLRPNGSPPFNMLFNENGLDSGLHNVSMTVAENDEGGMLQFDKAILFSLASGQRSSPLAEKINNQNVSVISYTPGAWQTQNDPQIPSRQDPSAYQQTNSFEASAWLNFTGRAVELRGESNWGWWTYEVTLNGQHYTGFNASNSWIVPDAVLFYQDGLDETTTHTLNITNTGSGGMNLALNSITAFHFATTSVEQNGTAGTVPSPTPSHGVSKGAIAGAVIATLAGTAILLGLLHLFLNRRKKASLHLIPRHNELLDSADENREVREVTAGSTRVGDVTLVSRKPLSPGLNSGNTGVETESYTAAPIFVLPTSTQLLPSQSPTSPLGIIEPAGSRFHEKFHAQPVSPPLDRSQRPPQQTPNDLPDSRVDSTVDRIASVVAERIAQRFGGLSREDMLSPPPEYGEHA